jgi:TPR repeat protein
VQAFNALGIMLEDGKGVTPNLGLAKECFSRAVEMVRQRVGLPVVS